MNVSIFEIGLLLCFGAAWPVSIYKSLTSKRTEGKSLFFLYLVLIGYAFGILHKLFYSRDFVIVLYSLNLLMVLTDILLYYRNRRLGQSQ